MPRNSLMISGKSPRFNFRMDKEVENILQQQTKDKSRFIREAIIHYWEYLGNRNIMPTLPTKFIPKEEPIEANKPESVSNGTWNPPWLSR